MYIYIFIFRYIYIFLLYLSNYTFYHKESTHSSIHIYIRIYIYTPIYIYQSHGSYQIGKLFAPNFHGGLGGAWKWYGSHPQDWLLAFFVGLFVCLFVCWLACLFVFFLSGVYLEDHPRTLKYLVNLMYKPFRPFGRGTTPVRGLANHGH